MPLSRKAARILAAIGAATGVFLASAALVYAAVIIVPGGGTGAASFTSGGLLRGNGTSPITAIAPGTNGQALMMVSGSPAWASVPASFDETQANTWLGTKTTSNLTEGSNLYYTGARWAAALAGTTTDALTEGSTRLYYQDARARSAISETITGIDYATSTGVFSITSGYGIPTSASQANWNTAYGWGDHSLAGYLTSIATTTVRGMFSGTSPISYNSGTGAISISTAGDWTGTLDGSNGSDFLARGNHTGTQLAATISDFSSTARGLISSTATGLTYTSGTGVISTTAGYGIPTTAKQTEWDTAYTNRITGANYPLSISSNTLSIDLSTTTASCSGTVSCSSFTILGSSPITITGSGGSGGGLATSTPWTAGNLAQVLSDGAVKSIATSSLGLLTTHVAEGSNLYWTDTRFDTRLAATTTLPNITTLANLGTVKTSLTGLLKASSGVLSAAVAGTDYESPLTFTYPLQRTANAISLAFGTTTSNTWGGTQTFTNAPVLTSLGTPAGAFLAVDGSGTIIATTTPSSGGSSQWTTNGSNIHFNTGNVGIGTSSPMSKLSLEAPNYTSSLMSITSSAMFATTTQVEVFSANGTYTKPARLYSATVQAVGAGGGGGNGAAGSTSGGGGSTAFQDADQLCVGTGGGSGVYKGNAGDNAGKSTGGGPQHTGPSGTNGGGSGGGSGSMATCTYTAADLNTTTSITIGMPGSIGAGGTGYFAGGTGSGGGATGAGSGGTGGSGGSPYGTITNGNNGGGWSSGIMGIAGAASVFGGAGGNGGTTNATSPATPSYPNTMTWGAGGGGGASTGSGQPGAQGVVIITSVISPAVSTTTAFTITPITNSNGGVEPAVGIGTTTPMAKLGIEVLDPFTNAFAISQYITASTTSGTQQGRWLTQLIDWVGHLYTGGPAPINNGCSGFTAITGNDRTGRVSMSGTSCTINFARSWDSAPVCTVAPGTASTVAVNPTASSLVVSFGTSQSTFGYICQGIK